MFKKNKFKVALVQMNSKSDLEENISIIERKIRYSFKKGAKLVLLPENCFFMAKNNKHFLKFSFIEITSRGVKSFKPLIRKASNPFVISASE